MSLPSLPAMRVAAGRCSAAVPRLLLLRVRGGSRLPMSSIGTLLPVLNLRLRPSLLLRLRRARPAHALGNPVDV